MNLTCTGKVAASALLLFFACQMEAGSISTTNLGMLSGSTTQTGALSDQGSVMEEAFTLGSSSTLTAYTTSYGGGNNLDGSSAAAGGFQSNLELFTASGQFVANQSFSSPIAQKDPATGQALDSYLFYKPLPAGSYILTLSDFLNVPSVSAKNLSDGFTNYGSGTTFSDITGATRSGNYALNISVAGASTATPEPASFWLTLLTMAIAVAGWRVKAAVRAEK